MAKKLKINIKNEQLQKALKLGGLKDKLGKKGKKAEKDEKAPAKSVAKKEITEELKEEPPRIRARSKSAFAEPKTTESSPEIIEEKLVIEETTLEIEETPIEEVIVTEPTEEMVEEVNEEPEPTVEEDVPTVETVPEVAIKESAEEVPISPVKPVEAPKKTLEKLGPTGRHVNDLLPKKKPPAKPVAAAKKKDQAPTKAKEGTKPKEQESQADKKPLKTGKFKEYRDVKPTPRRQSVSSFDSRDRQGLRAGDDDNRWRKRRPAKKQKRVSLEEVVRPTSLKIRLPVILKDLAQEMKLKASQLIEKLFLQGVVVTINSILDDEVAVQLLGHEFGCEITIDTTEEERIRITDKTISEEVQEADPDELIVRPPVVTFMGHVDHGKTSLIDYIRESNRTSGEAGDITQHIGAFRCHTSVGDIAILDTPGHEAFSAMRARGANVTDIVVLVIAGDEGIRAQTVEAIQHAKAAGVTIVVAINKCDKPNFDADNIYRQLSENDLLPESWGGGIITVNCSAVTGEGTKELLEMLALQAEVLELKASPSARARGTVVESQLHKGLGTVATILVQNGTLRKGDAIVFEEHWARVKTMRDEFGNDLAEAGPSTPVEITGLSSAPESGQEFIAVKNEKEARNISAARSEGIKQTRFKQKQMMTLENLLQESSESEKKILNIIIRGDVQGSVEALKVALQKISSDKAELNIIFTGVGEVSESDIQLAKASKAVIIGFHTQIESHADQLLKQAGVQVHLYDIIYHAIDGVKNMMGGLLDKLAQETNTGAAQVLATFKSSQLGIIAGCLVSEGTIHRNNFMRIIRGGEMVWKGSIASIKRVNEDVREVQKGVECGIVLSGTNDIQEGDILEAYEITYITQEL